METGARRAELFCGYGVGCAISMLAGAIAAWLSAQQSARWLFFIGMIGTSLLVPLLPGLQGGGKTTGWFFDDPQFITSAYAQSGEQCVGDTAFSKGFKAFFGVRDRYDKYAVVVASGKNPSDAQAKLKALSAEDASFKFRVAPRACDNDFYPVLASDYLPLEEAKPLLERAKKLKVSPDAYLTPGPR